MAQFTYRGCNMPNVSMILEESNQSILRPAVTAIIKQVQEITGIDPRTKIIFPGPAGVNHLPGSEIDDPDKRPQFNNDEYLIIEVNEEYDTDRIIANAVQQYEYPPVFSDPSTQTFITPVYSNNDIIITFRYRTHSLNEAQRWRDDIRMRVAMQRAHNLHRIEYHYPIPTIYLQILEIIHLCRERVSGYGMSFTDYLVRYGDDRMTVICDPTDKNHELVVAEAQRRIMGIYDFDTVPEKPSKESEAGIYTIEFNYRVSYQKAIGINIKYPVMVHNRLLPKVIIDLDKKDFDQRNVVNEHRSVTLDAAKRFESTHELYDLIDIDNVIRIPKFDHFRLAFEPKGVGTVFHALVEVDETNRRDLLNLHELDEIVLDRDVLQFMLESETPYMCRLYKSIIQLYYHRNDRIVFDDLECNTEGYVAARSELDLRNIHRVKLGIVTDLTLLDDAALERLRKYPKALYKIILAINEQFRNFPGVKELGKGYVTELDFNRLFIQIGRPLHDTRTPGYIDTGNGKRGDGGRGGYPNTGHPLDPLDGIRGPAWEDWKRNNIRQNTVSLSRIVARRMKDYGNR